MSQINIIILNDYGHVNGGAAQVAITTALSMAEKDFPVYYFCAVSPIDPRLQNHSKIEVICTKQPDILTNPNRFHAAEQGLWNFNSVDMMKKLLSTLRREETIIHVHGWTKALSHSPIYKALKDRYPVLVTIHDYFLACPNGGFYNYPKDVICTLKGLSSKCIATHCDSRSYAQKLWRVTRSIIQKNVARIPKGINDYITLSNLSYEIMRPYLPENARIYYLPNPIEIKKQERIEVERNQQYFAVGRLSPEKGLELFARAARDLGVEIVFIGDGPIKDNLVTINPDAQFMGWLPRNELTIKMRNARALVFSSKSYEAQGMVIAEAASLGVPSIVSEATAGKELITDNETGLLFHSNDQTDLMQKIRILQDNSIVRNLSCNVYNHYWEKPPTPEKYSDELEGIYLKVLGSHQYTSSVKRRKN